MALVVLLRGVNVGGNRTFRPSVLAKGLSEFDVVNIGAAGTLVARRAGARKTFLEALRKNLPFETEVMVCEGKEFLRMVEGQPFGKKPAVRDEVRFVSVLAKAGQCGPAVPLALPSEGEWLV